MYAVTETTFSAKFPSSRKKQRSAPPIRKKNSETREREHLFKNEIEDIRKLARMDRRNGARNETLILLMVRHGLRVSEASALKWNQINLHEGRIHVNRRKNGHPSEHPLYKDEISALRQLRREYLKRGYPDNLYVFMSERKTALSCRAIHQIVAEAGEAAGMPFPIHPHMLRHSTGHYLANKGRDLRIIQDYMGHKSIANTVIYTRLNANRFNNLWDD